MGRKRARKDSEESSGDEDQPPPATRFSEQDGEEDTQQKSKWINKQRVLIFGCRGLGHRDRHLMQASTLGYSKVEDFCTFWRSWVH